MKIKCFLLKTGAIAIFIFTFSDSSFSQNHKIDSLLSLLKKNPVDTSKINILISLAIQFDYGNPDTAFIYSEEALHLSEKVLHNTKEGTDLWMAGKMGLAKSYQLIAWANYNKGIYPVALNYFTRSLESWEYIERNGNDKIKKSVIIKKANTLNSIGFVYLNQGNTVKALDYFFKNLKTSEETNNKPHQATALSNIGQAYFKQKDIPRTLDYYLRGLKIVEEINDSVKIASFLGNLGNVYNVQKNYSMALEYSFKALKIAEKLANKKMIGILLGNIGNSFSGMKDYDKTKEYYLISLKNAGELKDNHAIARNYGNLGTLAIKTKNFAEAEKYLLLSVAMCDTMKMLEEKMEFENNLSELYQQIATQPSTSLQNKGTYALKAIAHLKNAMVAKDSLFNADKTAESVRKEMNYEFEKKELAALAAQEKKEALITAEINRQILLRNSFGGGAAVLLFSGFLSFVFYKRRRDAESKQKEAEFKSANSEYEMKALRAQINPHFIYNCLNAVQRYILKNDKTNAIDYLHKFASLMRMMLNNSEKEKVNLRDELAMLDYYIQLESLRFDTGFDYEIQVDETIDQDEALVPSMILQPFIENAIWHGLMHKPEKGKIQVRVLQENKSLKCIIEDNGIGRQKAGQIKISQPKAHQSRGMDITAARIELMNIRKNLKNSFKIFDLTDTNNTPNGTRVELFFQST